MFPKAIKLVALLRTGVLASDANWSRPWLFPLTFSDNIGLSSPMLTRISL